MIKFIDFFLLVGRGGRENVKIMEGARCFLARGEAKRMAVAVAVGVFFSVRVCVRVWLAGG